MALLLPCPFCGGKPNPKFDGYSTPVLEELDQESGGGWRVTCYGCGIGTFNGLHKTQGAAVTHWNSRAGAQDANETLRLFNAIAYDLEVAIHLCREAEPGQHKDLNCQWIDKPGTCSVCDRMRSSLVAVSALRNEIQRLQTLAE